MKVPLHPECRLLRLDPSGLLAVDKAVGILSHPNAPGDASQALMDLPFDADLEAFRDGETVWYLLNRLDAPTSGVVLLAHHAAVAKAVKAAFASHQVEKCYVALVKGFPSRKREQWSDCLRVKKVGGVLRTAPARGRPNAETRMELMEQGIGPPARALLSLFPETGKTHQLRVQCASRHLPIIGDATYGDFAFNRDFRKRRGQGRLFLHSWRTRLKVSINGQPLSFSAESKLPAEFTVALG